ncbi:hypothetical protein PTKIN_Ptkin03bG0108100 [Pterospermum kingtungense]
MRRTLSIILVFLFAVISTVNSCPPSDREAMLAFKTGTDCCHKWYGISCDPESNRVADINLRADWKGINGEIPKCINTLPFLRILDLIGYKISGEIPADIGRLQHLTVLNVADNQISGRIPPLLTNLSSLMHLDLRNNPEEIWATQDVKQGFVKRELDKRTNPRLHISNLSSRGFGPLDEQDIRGDPSLSWENGLSRDNKLALQRCNGYHTNNSFDFFYWKLELEPK